MKHIVKLTVSNPSHDFISMRSRIKQQDYITEARNESEAINRAARHFNALGFKVHTAVIVEQKVELPEPTALTEAVDYKALEKPTIARIKSGETKPVDRTDYNVPPGMRKKPIDKKAALEAFIARRNERSIVAEDAAPQYIEEKLTAADPASKWINDFVHSDNPKFAGKSKEERIRMALGAKYASMAEEVEQVDEASKLTFYSPEEVKAAQYHWKENVKPVYKEHGLSPEFASAVNAHVKLHGNREVQQRHGGADGNHPRWFNTNTNKVRPLVKNTGYTIKESWIVDEEVEQVDEASKLTFYSPEEMTAFRDSNFNKVAQAHYKKNVHPVYKEHGLSPKFAKAVDAHVKVHGSHQVYNFHGDADGNYPRWFNTNKNRVKPLVKNTGYTIKESWVVDEEVEQMDEARKMSRIEWRTGTPSDVAKNHEKIYKKLLTTDPSKAQKFLNSLKKKDVKEAADPGETKVVNKAVKTKKASAAAAAADRIVKIAKSKVNKVNMDPELNHDVKQSSRY